MNTPSVRKITCFICLHEYDSIAPHGTCCNGQPECPNCSYAYHLVSCEQLRGGMMEIRPDKVAANPARQLFDEYRKFTDDIATYKHAGTGCLHEIMHLTLGLCGEAGENADLVKKIDMPGKVVTQDMIIAELGDVFWYWIRLCYAHKLDPIDVIIYNVRKLRARYLNNG